MTGRNALWAVSVLTLFPELFPGSLGASLPGKALKDGLWRLNAFDIRSVATDKHATVDDTPYGGGAGMVMKVEVLYRALCSLRHSERSEESRDRSTKRGIIRSLLPSG